MAPASESNWARWCRRFDALKTKVRTGPGAQLIRVEDPGTGASGLVEEWTALYYPLLELFCVAREPLNLDRLAGLTDAYVRQSDLAVAVQRLRHFRPIANWSNWSDGSMRPAPG